MVATGEGKFDMKMQDNRLIAGASGWIRPLVPPPGLHPGSDWA